MFFKAEEGETRLTSCGYQLESLEL